MHNWTRKAALLFVAAVAALGLAPLGVACDGDEKGEGGATATPAATEAASPSPQATEAAFDEGLAARLQAVLESAVGGPPAKFPGAVLYVSSPRLGTWTGVAGLGDIESGTPMRPDDKFRVGSVVKTWVSVVVLQLVEEGVLSLDDMLPEVLPEDVVAKFPGADQVTVRMLLNHSSGIPDYLTLAHMAEVNIDPHKVWEVEEFLDTAARQKPDFAPGAGYKYSSTGYILLGLVIEQATGRSWREEVTERIVKPLSLQNTLLPEPGDVSVPGDYAHGYQYEGGAAVDHTDFDPSMAGAAGGGALVTTVSDLARFLKAVMAGELFDQPATLDEMLTFIDAPDAFYQVGSGLGIVKWRKGGGAEEIGKGGNTVGYTAVMGYVPAWDLYVVVAMNCFDFFVDPNTLLLEPASKILEAELSE